MKTKRILPLIMLLSLGTSIPQTVDAGFFDNLKSFEKKAGGAAIAAKTAPEAAAMFQGAAQSMHLADQSDDGDSDSDSGDSDSDDDYDDDGGDGGDGGDSDSDDDDE